MPRWEIVPYAPNPMQTRTVDSGGSDGAEIATSPASMDPPAASPAGALEFRTKGNGRLAHVYFTTTRPKIVPGCLGQPQFGMLAGTAFEHHGMDHQLAGPRPRRKDVQPDWPRTWSCNAAGVCRISCQGRS